MCDKLCVSCGETKQATVLWKGICSEFVHNWFFSSPLGTSLTLNLESEVVQQLLLRRLSSCSTFANAPHLCSYCVIGDWWQFQTIQCKVVLQRTVRKASTRGYAWLWLQMYVSVCSCVYMYSIYVFCNSFISFDCIFIFSSFYYMYW